MTNRPLSDPAASIIRHLTGELSEQEEIELLRSLEHDPARRELYDELRRMWEHSRLPKHEWDAYAALDRIKRRRVAPRAPLRVLPVRPARTLFRIAAGLALLAGSAAVWRLAIMPSAKSDVVQVPAREISTPRGQRATFQLSDGTRLVLAAESRLRVPADFGRTTRDVHLEGEALFEVVHDETRPFRVFAKDAMAEDLGTRFNVRAYPTDSVVSVAVAEGAVALGRPDTAGHQRAKGEAPQGAVLMAGELGTLAPKGRVTVATGRVVVSHFGWAEGHLSFFQVPLADVVRTLERWYDLDVRIEGESLASTHITAEFDVQSAEEMLRALALATGAKIKRSGKVITLHL